MTTIQMGDRTFPLLFTVAEMLQIQQEIGCTASELREKVLGYEKDDDDNVTWGILTDAEKAGKLATLIRILGNAGLEETGEDPDLTDKWILRHMQPGMLLAYGIVAMSEILDGMSMESPGLQEADVGPVDEVLEEQNAKKEPGN